jgi:hypothetical protein
MDARGDIHPITKHTLVREEHVADVNPDPHSALGVTLESRLDLAGTVQGIDRAVEARQRAVADLANHPAVEFRDQGSSTLWAATARTASCSSRPMIAV